MPLHLWPPATTGNETQTFQKSLPLLSVGSADHVVTWALPFADGGYTVTCGIGGGGVVLGNLTAVLKPGTRTQTGCTVTTNNGSLLSIAAGAELHVIAVGPLS